MTTLNTIRDRIRTELEAASGLTEPFQVTASRMLLPPIGQTRTMTRPSRQPPGSTASTPRLAVGTIDLTAADREIDISGEDHTDVERVWLDCDASHPGHPPRWVDFQVWPFSRHARRSSTHQPQDSS